MIIENLNEPTSKQTEFLLKSISTRLSSREDCRKTTYKVTIDHNGVSMSPLVYVFPNRYKRQESDKIDIVTYVHKYKMDGALLSGFVFGTYEYSSGDVSTKRKWRKLS